MKDDRKKRGDRVWGGGSGGGGVVQISADDIVRQSLKPKL